MYARGDKIDEEMKTLMRLRLLTAQANVRVAMRNQHNKDVVLSLLAREIEELREP